MITPWITTAGAGLVILLGDIFFNAHRHAPPHPSPHPTTSPTSAPTSAPTGRPTSVPTTTPQPTASPMMSPRPTSPTPTVQPTSAPSPVASSTSTPGPVRTSGPAPTPPSQPTSTPTPSLTPQPTSTPFPTSTPSSKPTSTPTAMSPGPTTAPTSLPTTTPSPSPGASNTNWSAPNDYPPNTWTPYAPSPNSVWNTPFQTSPAVVDPNSAKYQAFYSKSYPFFNQLNFGFANEVNQFGHPIYFGYSTDPVYSVKCLASWSTCVGSQKFHLPSYAIPAGGSDAHITTIDYTYSPAEELDCWATNKPSGAGGVLTAQACGSGPLTSDGLTFGQTGAGYAQWAGLIRAQELVAGNIPHALFMVSPCTSNATPVYPSNYRTTDSQCPSNQGIPYGARFRITLTPAQIQALSIPASHKAILTALALYGAYQGDNNGGYSFSFAVEADEMYTAPNYINSQCPTNGSPCTPITAWANSTGSESGATWTGAAYNIDLSKDINWATSGQWLLPPTNQP